MKSLILKIITFTIIMGIVAMTINTAFGHDTVLFLSKEAHYLPNGDKWYIWKFNWWGYVNNLQTSTTNTSILALDLPTRQWDNTVQSYQDFTNNLAIVVDYIIVILNVIIYPLKLGAYLILNILAVLGVNMDTTNANNGLAWLVTFVRDMLAEVSIPYI